MKRLTIILALVSSNLLAQSNHVAHFSIWRPKPDQKQNFEKGYKQHLEWHKANADPWDWYGWYIVSGDRYGQFVDATFNHAWSDFDKPVKPAEDMADNALHTFPFGDFQTGFKMVSLPELSIADTSGLKSKFLRLVTIDVTDIERGKMILSKLKNTYESKNQAKTFLTYKMVDGGDLDQLVLLLGFNSYAEYGHSDNLQEELSAIEGSLKVKTIRALTSETLVFRADMSLFAR